MLASRPFPPKGGCPAGPVYNKLAVYTGPTGRADGRLLAFLSFLAACTALLAAERPAFAESLVAVMHAKQVHTGLINPTT